MQSKTKKPSPASSENIIHLMKADNQGNDLADLNNSFIKMACRTFGGASVIEGKGLWYDKEGNKYEDGILRVIIGFNPSASFEGLTNNRDIFLNMAQQYKDDAMQEAVYIVMDNVIQFI
jgi:hypothetical protein